MRSVCQHMRGPGGCPLCDLSHAAIGFATTLLPPPWRAASVACFLVYQMLRTKPTAERLTSLAQYGAGALGRGLF